MTSKYASPGSKAWRAYVNKHFDKLKSVVDAYHPSNGRNYSKSVTAPAAEAARQDIVAEIEREGKFDFGTSVANKDESRVCEILNQTWFGVPESTDCWEIPGFPEMVNILEEGVLNESC